MTGLTLVLVITFVAGAAAFVAGSLILRSRRVPAAGVVAIDWTQMFGMADGAEADVTHRIDMLERLAIVAQPWCIETLRTASRVERDPYVRKAARSALKSARRGLRSVDHHRGSRAGHRRQVRVRTLQPLR